MAGKRWCSAPNCTNFRGKVANLSFFKFPKDVERCCIWIKNSGRDDLLKRNIAALYDSGLCLCAEHFGPDMFMNVELRNKLVSNAVPTLFESSENRTMILLPLKSSRSMKRKSSSPAPSPSAPRLSSDAGVWNGPSALQLPAGQPEPSPRDPGHGPQACSMEEGPYRPRSFELPGDGFPKRRLGQSSRSFQESWYLLYPWLEYSILKDAAFCFYCRLFVTQMPYRLERAFVYEGYRYWKNASLDMRLHCNSKVHTESKAAYDLYRRTRHLGEARESEGGEANGRPSVGRRREHLLAASRKSVGKVIDTVLFMGRQGLLLKNRRQRHLGGEGPTAGVASEEQFLQYLKWHARDDADLFPWLSQMQAGLGRYDDELDLDSLIALCVEEVQRGIVGEVNESGDGYFALLVDESCEESEDSKVVSVVVRYVNRQLRVHERFLGFWDSSGLSESDLCGRLWDILDDLGLRRDRLRALSFGVLAPRTERLAAVEALMAVRPTDGRLRQETVPLMLWVAPLAVPSHARSLNLVVQRLCQSIRPVRNVLQKVRRLYELFAWSSIGRSTCSELCLFTEEEETWLGGGEEEGGGEGFCGPLPAIQAAASTTFLCAVRDDIDLVVRGLRAIAAADSHQGAEAADLLESVETFHFVYYLHVMCKVLNMVDDLVCFLEDPDDFNVHRLSKLARAVVGTVRRAKTRDYFADTLEEVLRETDKLGVEPPPFLLAPPPKSVEDGVGDEFPQQRQVPSETEIEYGEHLAAICDVVERELATQFGVGRAFTISHPPPPNRHVLDSLDALVVDLRASAFSARKRDHFAVVVDHFSADLPADRLTNELEMFSTMLDVDPDWSGADLSKVHDLVCHFDEQGYAAVFPAMHQLLRTYLLMPTVPPRPDRDLSVLRRLQRHLQATAADPRRRPDEDAAVLAVEREEVLKLTQPDVLDGLAKRFMEGTFVSRRSQEGNGSPASAVSGGGDDRGLRQSRAS